MGSFVGRGLWYLPAHCSRGAAVSSPPGIRGEHGGLSIRAITSWACGVCHWSRSLSPLWLAPRRWCRVARVPLPWFSSPPGTGCQRYLHHHLGSHFLRPASHESLVAKLLTSWHSFFSLALGHSFFSLALLSSSIPRKSLSLFFTTANSVPFPLASPCLDIQLPWLVCPWMAGSLPRTLLSFAVFPS